MHFPSIWVFYHCLFVALVMGSLIFDVIICSYQRCATLGDWTEVMRQVVTAS